VKSAKLTCSVAGTMQELSCTEFPFEFTVPVADNADSFQCEVEAVAANGTVAKSGVIKLLLNSSPIQR